MSECIVLAQGTNHPEMVGADADTRSSPLGHRLMFVLLLLLAFVLYAPTTLLPLLKEHCELLAEEVRLKKVLVQLDQEIQHRDELAKAFAQDNVINERLAMLDLHYTKPDEEVLPVLPPDFAPPGVPEPEAPPTRSALGLPDDWPPWAIKAEVWANDRGLIGLFLDSGLRPVFYLMAAGLVIAAFVLFAPRRKGRRSRRNAARPVTHRA
jgi:hypothetical protein